MRKFNLNRVGKYARYAYFAMASATLLAIPCFASTGVAEIDTPINNLLTMFFGLLKVVGIFVGLFGLVQIVMAAISLTSTPQTPAASSRRKSTYAGITCIFRRFRRPADTSWILRNTRSALNRTSIRWSITRFQSALKSKPSKAKSRYTSSTKL